MLGYLRHAHTVAFSRDVRIFAVSDVHVDYDVNRQWVSGLSLADYRDDVLILAGDVSDSLQQLEWTLNAFVARFRKVVFVPGNHEMWVVRERYAKTSFEKFADVMRVASLAGASADTFRRDGISIVPLLGWYDYSFGAPTDRLKEIWADYHVCRWPEPLQANDVAEYFDSLNGGRVGTADDLVVTFSHFVPRLDVMPPSARRFSGLLDPVLGTFRLEQQLRKINARIHVYGHSHINRRVEIDGVWYVNNAFGNPAESNIAVKKLLSLDELVQRARSVPRASS